MLPIFITGNQDKVDYLNRSLGVKLEHQKVDLDEIQSPDPRVVIEHKAKQAFELLQRPVLVEDTSLSFNALHGLPGTFVKFFVESPDGLENMCRMLDGFTDRSAYASAVYGVYDGTTLSLFSGRLNGTIADHPRGEGGYGWDKIFTPEGFGSQTRAELSSEDDMKTYNMIRDFDGLRNFLKAR